MPETKCRRNDLRHMAVATAVTVFAPFLTACSSTTGARKGATAPAGATASQAADPNGILHVALSLASTTNANQWDPVKMVTPAQIEQTLVYDTLLRPQLDGTYKP